MLFSKFQLYDHGNQSIGFEIPSYVFSSICEPLAAANSKELLGVMYCHYMYSIVSNDLSPSILVLWLAALSVGLEVGILGASAWNI